ncbi:MAG: hypothetical protein ACRDLF_02175 [Solirubrobacteraceae bacterium]
MNTLLADPPAVSGTEQPPASGPPAVPPEGAPDTTTPEQPSPQGHTCAHCGAPLQEGQQWCLQCGACEPGSLGERPNWRPLTVLALLAALLAAGAAVAMGAALNKHKAAPRPVALAPTTTAPGATAPAVTTPATPALPTTPGAGGAGGTGTHAAGKGSANNLLFPPASATKPPKLPAPAAGAGGTPEKTGSAAEESTSGKSTTTPASTETNTSTTESKSKAGSGKTEQPTPLVLDTDAATTYNPSEYPPAGFGDPALAIDGEHSTAWTAQVQAASFPNMAEGLLINLRSPTKLGSIELATPTRGMTVQLYGAGGAHAPAKITDPGWTTLSGSHVLKKKVTHLKLRTRGRAFGFMLVWITKAPAASQGTAQAPGQVGISELVLYPPAA